MASTEQYRQILRGEIAAKPGRQYEAYNAVRAEVESADQVLRELCAARCHSRQARLAQRDAAREIRKQLVTNRNALRAYEDRMQQHEGAAS